MVSKTRNRAKKKDNKAVLTIQAFTDSAERIGVDAALYGLLAIIGIPAVILSKSEAMVLILIFLLIFGWNVTKLLNAYSQMIKDRSDLAHLRATRGLEILRKYKDKSEKIESHAKDEVR